METRKLQEVGGGTYTVSIPKSWADDRHLEAGAEMRLFTHLDGSIVLRTTREDGDLLGSARLAVAGDDPERVARALRAAYVAGYERVTLASPDGFTDAQRRRARGTVRDLVGVDLAAEGAEELTLESLLDAGNVSVRQSVAQLQFVALSVHRTGTEALVGGQTDASEAIGDREEEAARLAAMVSRHLNRALLSLGEVDRLGLTRPELLDYRETARHLAAVAKRGVALARAGSRRTGPLPDAADDLRAAASTARQIVEDATTAVLEGGDVADAHDALERRDRALETVDSLERDLLDASDAAVPGLGAGEIRALTRGLDGLTRTAERGGAVAQVALRAAARAQGQ